MKNIIVKNCNNCVFNSDEYNEYSSGDSNIMVCQLSYHSNEPNYIICSYNINAPIVNPPEWCLLRKNDYNITLFKE